MKVFPLFVFYFIFFNTFFPFPLDNLLSLSLLWSCSVRLRAKTHRCNWWVVPLTSVCRMSFVVFRNEPFLTSPQNETQRLPASLWVKSFSETTVLRRRWTTTKVELCTFVHTRSLNPKHNLLVHAVWSPLTFLLLLFWKEEKTHFYWSSVISSCSASAPSHGTENGGLCVTEANNKKATPVILHRDRAKCDLLASWSVCLVMQDYCFYVKQYLHPNIFLYQKENTFFYCGFWFSESFPFYILLPTLSILWGIFIAFNQFNR